VRGAETVGDVFVAVMLGMCARLCTLARVARAFDLGAPLFATGAPRLERGGIAMHPPVNLK
jgi:hypothetical protein